MFLQDYPGSIQELPSLKYEVYTCSAIEDDAFQLILIPKNSPVPMKKTVTIVTVQSLAYLPVFAKDDGCPLKLAELVFTIDGTSQSCPVNLDIVTEVSIAGDIDISVLLSDGKAKICGIVIPSLH